MLDDPIHLHLRLNEAQKEILSRAGFKTIRNLLWHFPARYEEFREPKAVADLVAGDEAEIRGQVVGSKKQKTWRTRIDRKSVV